MITWRASCRLVAIGALLLVPGCVFDRSGVAASQAPDADGSQRDTQVARDQPAGDQPAVDLSKVVDLRLSDGVVADKPVTDVQTVDAHQVPDQAPPSDSKIVKPVNATALGQSFFATQVPCVLKNGQSTGGQTPVADSASVAFFNGTITLNGAAADTLAWVGGKPTVTVLFDINACDDEAPSGSSSWSSAGLLVRGATLSSGALVLSTGTTVKDINLLDINTNGTLQGEFVKPDDSLLHTYPQLVNPTNKAKELIVTLAGL